MPTQNPISLIEPGDSSGTRITQLFSMVELLSEGDPVHNSLFVMEPGKGPLGGGPSEDRLLVIDPPQNLQARFRLPEQTAILPTTNGNDAPLPRLQTMPGGVAHVRIGEQFLDVYAQQSGAVVVLPPLGLLWSGPFGSDLLPPPLPEGGNGESELETLRLLARLLKQHRVRVLIPRVGTLCADATDMMARLATDVAYLHALRRAVLPQAGRPDAEQWAKSLGDDLLPSQYSHSAALAVHRLNIRHILSLSPH